MEQTTVETTPKQERGAGFVFAGLALLYLLACLCLVVGFVVVARQNIPFVRDYFPSPSPIASRTPIRTATPIVHQPSSGDTVTKVDFSKNSENWHSKWINAFVAIKDGHLSFSAYNTETISVTQCNTCAYHRGNFYLEADFSTNQSINEQYGFAFNIQEDYGRFYCFLINAQQGYYVFYKKIRKQDATADNVWMRRLSKNSELINPYPKSNKLAVAFNKDVIELYINGVLVETYQDPGTDLTSGDFGFYMHGGFEMMVDNLFAYGQ